jgi:hypothetical protein
MRQTIRFIEGLVMLMISGIALFYFKLPIVSAVGVFVASLYFYLGLTEEVE